MSETIQERAIRGHRAAQAAVARLEAIALDTLPDNDVMETLQFAHNELNFAAILTREMMIALQQGTAVRRKARRR